MTHADLGLTQKMHLLLSAQVRVTPEHLNTPMLRDGSNLLLAVIRKIRERLCAVGETDRPQKPITRPAIARASTARSGQIAP